ncbi:MAG: hypothetical protein ABIG11_06910, partial [bacterium]
MLAEISENGGLLQWDGITVTVKGVKTKHDTLRWPRKKANNMPAQNSPKVKNRMKERNVTERNGTNETETNKEDSPPEKNIPADTAPKKGRKKKEPMSYDPEVLLKDKRGHVRLLGYFIQQWEAAYREKYIVTNQQQAFSQAARLWAAVKENSGEAAKRIKAYLAMDDEWTKDTRHSFAVFESVLHKCVPKKEVQEEEAFGPYQGRG